MFTDRVFKELVRAGWIAGRSIDIADWVERAESLHIEVGAAHRAFLREFGQLSFVLPDAQPPAFEDWTFCQERVLTEWGGRWAVTYSAALKVPMAPIGWAGRDHMLLLMAEEGQVFGAFDEFVCEIGTSGADALESLCTGRPLRVLDGLEFS